MKYVYVLEKELKFQKEIHEALLKVNPALQLRYFTELESFANWINLAMKEGNKALSRGGTPFVANAELPGPQEDDRLVLLVSSNEMIGSRSMALLKKTHQLFLRKALCSAEEPTSVVITSFDDPDFDIRAVEDRLVNNVIYKPFDLMILQQHLNNAVNGRHPPSENNLHNMKTSAKIEMLKEIAMENISTFGFTTLTDREVPVGSISKFYGPDFTSGKTQSVMAKCLRCTPHATLPGQSYVTMGFFGLEVEQIRDLRKTIAEMKDENKIDWNWNIQSKKPGLPSISFVVLDEKKQMLGDTLQRNFNSSTVTEYSSWEHFQTDFDPSQNPIMTQTNFPQGLNFKLHFDLQGHYVLGCDPKLKDGEKIFGQTFEQLKKIDLGTSLEDSMKAQWYGLMRAEQPLALEDQKIVSFDIQNQKRLVKLTQRAHITAADGVKVIEVTFDDLKPEERLAYLKSISKWPQKIDVVVMSSEFHRKIKEDNLTIPGIQFLIAEKGLTDDEELEFGATVQDIFVTPFDRNYMTAKIKACMGYLDPDDQLTYRRVAVVKVANPVEITEISESGVVLKYQRAMPLGSFRKFILWSPKETELLEYLGNCNFTEAVEGEEPHFVNHFVFFGIKDQHLKNIRLWIRDNYIQSKEAG